MLAVEAEVEVEEPVRELAVEELVLVCVEVPHGLLLVVPFEEQEQEQEVVLGLEAPLVVELGLGPAVEWVLGLEAVQHVLLLALPLES